MSACRRSPRRPGRVFTDEPPHLDRSRGVKRDVDRVGLNRVLEDRTVVLSDAHRRDHHARVRSAHRHGADRQVVRDDDRDRPFVSQLSTFSVNKQSPRSISTILPFIAAPFVNGRSTSQPRTGSAATRSPLTPATVKAGPNDAGCSTVVAADRTGCVDGHKGSIDASGARSFGVSVPGPM